MKKRLPILLFIFFFISKIPAQELHHVLGEILVQINPKADIKDIARQLNYFKNKPTKIKIKKELSAPMHIWLLEFDYANINENHFLNKIINLNDVRNAQLNRLVKMRQNIPNDPNFDLQWMWLNTGQNGGLPDADIDADLAWDITTGGQTMDGHEIVVCIIEGCNRDHPDLQGNLWFNEQEIPGNNMDDDGNGYVDDYNGWNITSNNDFINSENHGTITSGMVGAKGNNGLLITGINWDVKIMHVDYNSFSEADAVEAYTYPLIMRRLYNQTGGEQGAFVVATNLSAGIDGGDPADSPLWCAIYDTLGTAGILNCAATTNDDVNVDIVGDIPTACSSEYLIAVTSTDDNDMRTSGGYGIENVDVAAPGIKIVSINVNGGPHTDMGTSFASPTVAGLIALVYSSPCFSLGPLAIGEPSATAGLVRDAIFNGVDNIPNLADEIKTGGRINAFNSIQYIMQNCGPCPAPFAIEVIELNDISATLDWVSTDSTISTTIEWRAALGGSWTTVENISSPFLLEGLMPCTRYLFRLKDICQNQDSGFTEFMSFETDGCCVPPGNIIVGEISETQASINWEAILAANSYNLLLTTPQGTELIENIENTFLNLSGLSICTAYGVQLQTVCDTGLTVFSPITEFKTTGCGACTDLPYCPSNSEDASEEWIENVSIGSLDNTSGSDMGYGDYTGLSTDLLTFETYNISLTPGFESFGFSEWFTVFIDYNQDGDFGDPGEEVFDPGIATNQTVQGDITVPEDAMTGLTRMRVVMQFNNEPEACAVNIDHGEVEDYCINILQGTIPDCQRPNGLAAGNIETTSAEFSWNTIADANSYNVRIRPVNTMPWVTVSSSSTSFSAFNLIMCSDYEFQVQSVCVDGESNWTESFVFETKCMDASVEQFRNINDWSLFPNPFSDKLTARVDLVFPQEIVFKVFDINGQLIAQKPSAHPAGETQVVLLENAKELAAGLYFIKMETAEGDVYKKVLNVN